MPTILVADDDAPTNQLLAETLTDEGFAVETAAHGGEALEVLARCVPDAIVLDLRMPVMDGRTFYRHLRQDALACIRDIPVMILSAERSDRVRRELGAEAALDKPFDLDDLIDVLAELVAPRQTMASH